VYLAKKNVRVFISFIVAIVLIGMENRLLFTFSFSLFLLAFSCVALIKRFHQQEIYTLSLTCKSSQLVRPGGLSE
jgi:hypothetical protein